MTGSLNQTRKILVFLVLLQIIALIALVAQGWNINNACTEALMNQSRETSLSNYGSLTHITCIINDPENSHILNCV